MHIWIFRRLFGLYLSLANFQGNGQSLFDL
jgi:hypothetical protein